jgi:hypothetical protein
MEATLIILAVFAVLCVVSGISKHFVVVLALLLLGGCASTPENLQVATAQQVPGVSPQQVQVSQIQRSATQVQWVATTPKGAVHCWADDMVRRVVCRP